MPYADDAKAALAEFKKVSKNAALDKNQTQAIENVKKTALELAKLDSALQSAGTTVKTTPKEAAMKLAGLKKSTVPADKSLKASRDECEKQTKVLGPPDKDLKTGFEVLGKRLEAIKHQIKQNVLMREQDLSKLASGGAEGSLDAKQKVELQKLYLGLKKACDETEALIKVFRQSPTDENIKALFSSSTGPRSIGVAVTIWKKMIAQDKSLPDKLLKAGGADMVHLYETKGFYEATQNKGLPFWQKELKTDKIGWQRGVGAQADFMLKYTGHFRRCAEAIKTMVK